MRKLEKFLSTPQREADLSFLKSIEDEREQIIARFGEDHYRRLYASIQRDIESGESLRDPQDLGDELSRNKEE
jgi:hypothetical protein